MRFVVALAVSLLLSGCYKTVEVSTGSVEHLLARWEAAEASPIGKANPTYTHIFSEALESLVDCQSNNAIDNIER